MKKDWVASTPDQYGEVVQMLGRFKITKPVRVTIEHYIASRSQEQNAKYWACLGEAAKHIGCSADDIHEDLLCKYFGGTEHKLPSGRIVQTPNRRSSELNKKDFSEYLDFCINFLNSELGMQLA